MHAPHLTGASTTTTPTCAAEARAAAAPVGGPSFEQVLAARMASPAGPTRMTPAEVVLALRGPVAPAVDPSPRVLPPVLSNPLIWQVQLQHAPLPSAPAERFDAFRTRVERAGLPRQATLDVRVTETNGRVVRCVPERRSEWRGRVSGARVAEALASLRRGRVGWSELTDFAARARLRLERLQARWAPLEATHPVRGRVGEALRELGGVLASMGGAAHDKRVEDLPALEKAAQQAQRAMDLARGRG